MIKLQYAARKLPLSAYQVVNSQMIGRHRSRSRGRGMDFEELRHYRPGDDIRTIDWKATARLRNPHVRVYTEERERPILFVVDQRQSMFFGSAGATKATAAAKLAALGAWRGLDVGDRVGHIDQRQSSGIVLLHFRRGCAANTACSACNDTDFSFNIHQITAAPEVCEASL